MVHGREETEDKVTDKEFDHLMLFVLLVL